MSVVFNSVTGKLSNGDTFIVRKIDYAINGYRVLHDLEIDGNWRLGMPEVFRLDPTHQMPFNEAWQVVSYEINTTLNPLVNANMDKSNWRQTYGYTQAFMNSNGGFDGEVHADFINRRDLGASNPYLDIIRVCGGAWLQGIVEGNNLIVRTLNGNADPPPLQYILDNHLYFEAVYAMNNGVGRFPMGQGERVFIPLVSRQTVRFPLDKLQEWVSSEIPNPYMVYNPV